MSQNGISKLKNGVLTVFTACAAIACIAFSSFNAEFSQRSEPTPEKLNIGGSALPDVAEFLFFACRIRQWLAAHGQP